MRAFFLFLLTIPLVCFLVCCKDDGPTGYKAGVTGPDDSYIVETCKEEEFLQKWWSIETDNVIANTLVPSYKDYCTYVDEDYVFFWHLEEQYGYYNYDFYWKCANENTMYITSESTGDEIEMRIYGQTTPGCYDVKITYGANIINADLCSCEYNGP
jgi:hypothetical protein